MRANVAYLRRTVSVAIGVIFIIGIGGPVRAEPISNPIDEQTPGDSATSGTWPKTVGSPASNSSGVEGAKNTATVTKPAQEQPQGDPQSPSPPHKRPEQQLTRSGSQTNEAASSPEMTKGLYEDWTLDREFKEAIRPLYEDLKATGVVEAMRTLKTDLGLNSGDQASSDYSRELAERLDNRSANQSRTQPTVQTEHDRLATAALWKDLVDEIKPWLFGLAGLYILGYLLKLWRDYLRWKTTRSRKRSSKSKRHHRHHRRPQGTPDKAVLDPGAPVAGNGVRNVRQIPGAPSA